MTHSFRPIIASMALALSTLSPGFALDVPATTALIESDSVRRAIAAEWLDDGINGVMALKETRYTDRYLFRFTVFQKKDATGGFLAVTVRPDDSPTVRGTWVLFRRLADGQADSIRIYPSDDSELYVRLRPSGDVDKGRTLVDLVIRGVDAHTGVPLGVPFHRLYGASFASIMEITSASMPWNLLAGAHRPSIESETAVSAIREGLKTLVYLDDGAFDERGQPVLIETGKPQDTKAILSARPKDRPSGDIYGGVNCSGFAKWIVDGIVRPRVGGGLKIGPLKDPTPVPESLFVDPYVDERDVFFALNWTRNLAAAIVSLDSGRTVSSAEAGVDVTIDPLSGIPPYQVNVGYRASALAPLLYYLAVTEPGHFYLGAVSRERGEPPLRQYHHVAAFFPYFAQDGRFTVAVFESAVETTIESFTARNADAFVNLVRVRLPEAGNFEP